MDSQVRTTATSENRQMLYFCAHKGGESAPESFAPEDRSDTCGKQSMSPSTQSGCSQTLEAGKAVFHDGYKPELCIGRHGFQCSSIIS